MMTKKITKDILLSSSPVKFPIMLIGCLNPLPYFTTVAWHQIFRQKAKRGRDLHLLFSEP